MKLIPLLLCLFVLSACGVKPGSVDAPQGTEVDRFPRAYPDPSTYEE